MTTWCHANDCNQLIENNEEHLGVPPGSRSHVRVRGVPFCTDCHEQNGDYHRIRGVPVRHEDVTIVVGDGTPATSELYEEVRGRIEESA